MSAHHLLCSPLSAPPPSSKPILHKSSNLPACHARPHTGKASWTGTCGIQAGLIEHCSTHQHKFRSIFHSERGVFLRIHGCGIRSPVAPPLEIATNQFHSGAHFAYFRQTPAGIRRHCRKAGCDVLRLERVHSKLFLRLVVLYYQSYFCSVIRP